MTTAVQKQQPTGMERLKSMLNAESVKAQFASVLEKSAPTFMASLIDLYNTDTYLQKCDPKEVVMEALKAAVLKLPLNKALGFSYLVPYNNSVKTDNGWQKKLTPTFILGYKGLIQLAMRTGQYRIINADMVYEGEARVISKLTGELKFDGERESDKVMGYFAHFEMLNGFSKTLYMSREEVIAHAKRFSKSYGNAKSPWETDFNAMALKTCLRGLFSKWGYLSVEMAEAIDRDIRGDSTLDKEQHANQEYTDFDEAEAEEVVNKETGEVQQPDNGSDKQDKSEEKPEAPAPAATGQGKQMPAF